MGKFNRKLRQLNKKDYIKKRVCKRSVAWRHEDEYKANTRKAQHR